MRSKLFPLVLAAAAAAACNGADAPTGTAPRQPAGASSMDRFAFGVAVAMNDAGVRADVRDAMRASPLVQHRLVLRDFLASHAADRLVGGVGAALHLNAAGVRSLAAGLGDLDFYVPMREDRQSWTATGNVVVAGVLQYPRDGRMTGFTPAGAQATVRYNQRDPGAVVFQLSPKEDRVRRVSPQAAVPGKVIEEMNDGVLAGTFTWTDASGRSVTTELADLQPGRKGPSFLIACGDEGADPSCDQGSYTPPPPSDTTYLEYFSVAFDDCSGDPDPSFSATYYSASGTQLGTGQVNYSEIPRNTAIYPHVPLILNRIQQGTTQKIRVHVIERDNSWCGGDDDEGSRDFIVSDNNQARAVFKGSTFSANVQLKWTPKY
jgi:hypothetical protein